MRLVHDVSAKLRNSNLEVPSILSMELDVAIIAEECQLGVVVAKHYHLDDLRIDSPLHLHRQVTSLKNLHSWRVHARRHNIVLVFGNTNPLGGAPEIQVLDQVNPVAVLL